MGFRTVVILYNDQASEWSEDPGLGRKIYDGMNRAGVQSVADWNSPANLHYGNIMECAHADTCSLFSIDSYYGRKIGSAMGSHRAKADVIDLELLQNAAAKMGYKLIKTT
jgi:hypothetical protein